MTTRNKQRFLTLLCVMGLAALPLRAQAPNAEELVTPGPAVATATLGTATPSEPANLEEAKARIHELEARLAELEAAKANAPAATPAPAIDPETAYRVDTDSDQMRFLNLGVRKNYMAVERSRLVEQIHTMIPPLYEPAFSPLHGYTLPQGAFRVDVNTDRFTNDHDFGRDKFYSLFFNNVKVQSQGTEVGLNYGLTNNNTLRIIVPLRSTIVSGDGHPFRIAPMVMTMNGHGFGLGDVQVLMKHKWLDQGNHRFNLATVFGIQLPTGKNDAKFDDAQILNMMGMPTMAVASSTGGPKVDLFSDDLKLNNGIQPGTGAWGVTFGVMGTRQLTWNRFRGALHGGATYKAMKSVDGIRPGNELTFAASFVRPPTRSEHFTFDFTVFGRNKQAELYPGTIMHPEADANGMPILNPDMSLKMFVTPRPPFEHGTVVFASPSLVIIPKPSIRLTVSPLFRIYQPNQGPTPAFRLVFGATTTF